MTELTLELADVTYRYRRADREALSGVSLVASENRSIGIVGESGSGKSTALALLLGLSRPTSGQVRVSGRELNLGSQAARHAFRREVQPVFQDPYTSLDPRQRIGSTLAEPLVSLRLERDRAARADRVAQVLRDVGLEPAMATRWPHEFSGGQRQRIAIARALITEPRIVLADEPVSALDVTTKIEVIDLLRKLRRDRGLGLVMVSHDLSVVSALCTDVVVLVAGNVVEAGPTREVMASPRHEYTRKLIAAVPRLTDLGLQPTAGAESGSPSR
ncbi:ABC transporter ATP-binding protein [Xylanimonas ulmi]|uniref:Oligopeptide/dipeptide transporter n=1 Tax=Xylanimonas ulmi TaxID=228973 RepID=A0A4Q7LZB5_9MICO|nr:ABC transporter ATP-binding protein [Xylanibacterium ulmi]RZS60735.1 oligopeptide/dipeptide transporter [Xylanibacterium ulmi]